jgi:hypothetical protein
MNQPGDFGGDVAPVGVASVNAANEFAGPRLGITSVDTARLIVRNPLANPQPTRDENGVLLFVEEQRDERFVDDGAVDHGE